jgi:protein TonB
MTLYGLRLLVALLTFAVGIAAAWLFNFKSTTLSVGRGTTAISVLVADEQPPPRRSCSFESRRIIAGGVINGKAISKPQPVYPPAAKDARVSGTVVVQIEVGEDGRVVKAEAISGPETLRGASEDAARAARFSPTRLSGEPVRVSGVITYNFVLD